MNHLNQSQNLKTKKFLFVSLESLSGDLAWQLTKEGHSVKSFIKAKNDQDAYQGFIERVDDWERYIDWADIILFDDVEFGETAEKLRKKGKLVIGGSKYTDRLEIDREFGQMEMKKYGINILPQWNFSNYDEAIAFIKTNPSRYVFKPSGNTPSGGKGLLYLGEEEDSKDLLEILSQNKDIWQKKAPTFQLQKYVAGVEVAVGAFFNGKDFIYPICVNFEHKRVFPGNLGPFAGEMGCYDEKTEVLTKKGWKYFKNLNYEDEIATLNSKTNQLEFCEPSKIVAYSHYKEMIQIKNRSIDILVTPNHNMWIQERDKKEWEFVRADSVFNRRTPKIARTANWKGKEYEINKARFLGIYLAEGSASKPKNHPGGYRVFITGTNIKKIRKIQEILNKTNLNWKRNKDGWYLYGKDFYNEFSKYGKSYEKFIPQEIKEANTNTIKAFLDAYALGDATLMRGGWRIFYTSSKRMADDIQELLLKIGRVGLIKERNRFKKKIFIKDHYTQQRRRAFEVIERVKKIYSYLDKRDAKIIKYNGKVYCATVPSHIMYVRRNGKPFWCGNTLMFWSPPNLLFKSTLEKMKTSLAESGYIGYIDINSIVNGRGIYPLEWTCRFGYPTIQIQSEGILTPAGEWLYKLARGENFELKTKRGFQVGIRLMVPSYFVQREDSELVSTYRDLPIFFKKPVLDGVHIEDVKIIDGVWRIAGTSGCILVVTGSGTTVTEARRQAYSRIKNIMIQNMFYRVDIGTRWYEESDKLQIWGYL